MKKTTKKLLSYRIREIREFDKLFGIPFGRKQVEIFKSAFLLDYNSPKNSDARKSLAWKFWDRWKKV